LSGRCQRYFHQDIDGSEVVDRRFDRLGSRLLLADIAIDENRLPETVSFRLASREVRRRYNLPQKSFD